MSSLKEILYDEKKLKELTKIAFDSVDKDGSGSIDQYELESVLAKISNDMGAEPPSKDDIKELLKYLDTDKSGKIEFKEFEVLIKNALEFL